jgi:hypothetical protein
MLDITRSILMDAARPIGRNGSHPWLSQNFRSIQLPRSSHLLIALLPSKPNRTHHTYSNCTQYFFVSVNNSSAWYSPYLITPLNLPSFAWTCKFSSVP